MELPEILAKLTKLPRQDLTPVLDLFESADVPTNKSLLIPGAVCQKIWLVSSGSLRSYYMLEERKRGKSQEGNGPEDTVTREVTNWVIPTGGLYTDMQSYLPQTPSSYYVETLQTSRLFTLSHPNYVTLSETHSKIAIKIFEQISARSEFRIKMGNYRHPEDRLRMFELSYPGMTAILSVNVLATCLNIDPNTLSKLRAKKQ